MPYDPRVLRTATELLTLSLEETDTARVQLARRAREVAGPQGEELVVALVVHARSIAFLLARHAQDGLSAEAAAELPESALVADVRSIIQMQAAAMERSLGGD